MNITHNFFIRKANHKHLSSNVHRAKKKLPKLFREKKEREFSVFTEPPVSVDVKFSVFRRDNFPHKAKI